MAAGGWALMVIRILRETSYVTTRCPVCQVEREEIEGSSGRMLFCCGEAVDSFRTRLVCELSDGRCTETIAEDGQKAVTRWVGHYDG